MHKNMRKLCPYCKRLSLIELDFFLLLWSCDCLIDISHFTRVQISGDHILLKRN